MQKAGCMIVVIIIVIVIDSVLSSLHQLAIIYCIRYSLAQRDGTISVTV